MIKNIVKDLKPSATLRINEQSKELESKGKKIFKFGFGQSPFQIPLDIVKELKNNAHQNKYLPMQGLPELRNSIAKYITNIKKYNYKDDNVIIGPGTKELMFLLNILFDGDILLPAPSWVSYEPQAILGRNKTHWIDTKRENNWFPTGEEIEKIILKDRSKKYLLFLNSPNNPSGQVCNNLKEISQIAKKYSGDSRRKPCCFHRIPLVFCLQMGNVPALRAGIRIILYDSPCVWPQNGNVMIFLWRRSSHVTTNGRKKNMLRGTNNADFGGTEIAMSRATHFSVRITPTFVAHK